MKLFQLLTQAVAKAYPTDKATAGVVVAYLAPNLLHPGSGYATPWYVSICRYPDSPHNKVVVAASKGRSLNEATRLAAKQWLPGRESLHALIEALR